MKHCDLTNRFSLTHKEFEIIQLLYKGHTMKSIAKLLQVSPRTIGSHCSNIYRRLQCHSKTEAIYKVLELNKR